MKASSVGLETEIRKLSEEEIESLEEKSITGALKFYEVNSDKTREIPFELKLNPSQKDFVKVEIKPQETYFGKADKIIFFINREYYKSLQKSGIAAGARFCTAGKLILSSENHRNF